MKRLNILFTIMAVLGLTACDSAQKAEKPNPMFWATASYTAGFEATCAALNEAGIEGILLTAQTADEYRTAVATAQQHNIAVYAALPWSATMIDQVESICHVDGLWGISLDYHHCLDLTQPACWGAEGPDADLATPTEAANQIAQLAHAHGLKMAAQPFATPKLAAELAGQDWSAWDIDLAFPMVYPEYFTQDVSFVADCMISGTTDKRPTTQLYCGLTASDDLMEQIEVALNNGAAGIAIHDAASLTADQRAQLHDYTANVKASWAANGGVNPSLAKRKKLTDPFENMRILGMVNAQIKEYCQMPIPNITSYTPTGEEEHVKHYSVRELNVLKTYQIDFFFHGGILSGWRVSE